jgi:Ca2+:H+ antiporter
MVESDDPTSLELYPPQAHVSKFRRSGADRRPTLPLNNPSSAEDADQRDGHAAGGSHRRASETTGRDVAEERSSALPPPAPPPTSEEPHGEASPTIELGKKPNIMLRFYNTSKEILLSSYINILLVFVPIGIAINFTNVSPTVVFAMNAIAIIPLAKLLCYATDSVALSMGDTIGALMNITFGNAVELIILSVSQRTLGVQRS